MLPTNTSVVIRIREWIDKVSDSRPVKILGILSAVITIFVFGVTYFTHRQPAASNPVKARAPVASKMPDQVQKTNLKPKSQPLVRRVVQISYGAQSPNVSGVGGNVDIRYGSQMGASPEQPAETGK